ncbi:MAG TPA: chromosome segregation protein SMC, partial [Methyloceanibacter sp.]
EQLDCAPEACLALAGMKPGVPLPSLAEVEGRLTKLRGDRERLGGVNLRAEEEEADISTRLEEMEREKADVEQAIARLRQGISNLNREGRKRLLEAFDSVNAHFQRLFQTLFGGGTAELQLVDSDDPLESGLEIMACPPGKRPQVLTLLSGGEKALTALALIFAVFLTNPSPICVLDEVDAPLDDANVERFCLLMEEMAKETDTRFLIITHHPLTMSRMSRLFGVTMAERGVSQLVSVDLETAERLRDAS